MVVATGLRHTLMLCTHPAGTSVFVFGDNTSGQLGLGDYISRKEPTHSLALAETEVTMIAAGNEHSVFFSSQRNEVYTSGRWNEGQLGVDGVEKPVNERQHDPCQLFPLCLSARGPNPVKITWVGAFANRTCVLTTLETPEVLVLKEGVHTTSVCFNDDSLLALRVVPKKEENSNLDAVARVIPLQGTAAIKDISMRCHSSVLMNGRIGSECRVVGYDHNRSCLLDTLESKLERRKRLWSCIASPRKALTNLPSFVDYSDDGFMSELDLSCLLLLNFASAMDVAANDNDAPSVSGGVCDTDDISHEVVR